MSESDPPDGWKKYGGHVANTSGGESHCQTANDKDSIYESHIASASGDNIWGQVAMDYQNPSGHIAVDQEKSSHIAVDQRKLLYQSMGDGVFMNAAGNCFSRWNGASPQR
jgi:hypothetical protein